MTIKRCYPVLVGASVAENQLARYFAIGADNGITYTWNDDGSYTLNGTATEDSYRFVATGILANHVGFTSVISASSDVKMWFAGYAGSQAKEKIYKPSDNYSVCLFVPSGVTLNNVKAYPQFTDLSLYLPANIVDYIYSLEQATAGSGIAWLRSYGFLTDDHVPYNAGSIESVEATAKMVMDENGENAITYPLGSDVLRGIFKLDANNQLYADGDRKEADGTITRKYGIVDLGTLNWNMYETNHFYANLPDVKIGLYAQLSNAMCSKYAQSTMSNLFDKTFAVNNGQPRINIYDSAYSDAATFKTSMNGVMLVYELATPTTEQSTPFTSPQVCYPDGTEEFVTENGVPVGHETKYQL